MEDLKWSLFYFVVGCFVLFFKNHSILDQKGTRNNKTTRQ